HAGHRHSTSLLLCAVFFKDPPTTEISTLSLHDALPILARKHGIPTPGLEFAMALAIRYALSDAGQGDQECELIRSIYARAPNVSDRKSTRLNSSHVKISYAVFCLKKKKINTNYENV